MKATLSHYRQSPRKVRLVADLIRGKRVSDAQTELRFLNKRAAAAVSKLLSSAAANAKNGFHLDPDHLLIESIEVNEGRVLKRYLPRARGRATILRKRSSHITVTLKADAAAGKKKEEKEARVSGRNGDSSKRKSSAKKEAAEKKSAAADASSSTPEGGLKKEKEKRAD